MKIRILCVLLLTSVMLAIPAPSSAQIAVGVSIRVGPPRLPVYTQPICPGPGYLWTPGYWAYGTDDYYWVPGTWVMPPRVGVLWTPGYWGWGGGFYAWHAGYWGPHVGFYGGINYGFGYGGVGYWGGRWDHGVFAYNRAYNNVNVTVNRNTYNRTVVNNNVNVNRTSFNGGTGGTSARPTASEESAAREQHTAATSEQSQHEHAASTNRAQFASQNHGRPQYAATGKPGDFSGHGSVAARGFGNQNRGAGNGNGNHSANSQGATHHNASYNSQHNNGAQHNNAAQPNHQPHQGGQGGGQHGEGGHPHGEGGGGHPH